MTMLMCFMLSSPDTAPSRTAAEGTIIMCPVGGRGKRSEAAPWTQAVEQAFFITGSDRHGMRADQPLSFSEGR